MAKKSAVPTRKVTAGVIAGALLTLGMMVGKRYGVTFSEVEQGALTTLIVFAIQYMVPESSEPTDPDGEL